MNIYVIVIITGIVLQFCGVCGYLWETRLKEPKTITQTKVEIYDVKTGRRINGTQYSLPELLKEYKLVKRSKK